MGKKTKHLSGYGPRGCSETPVAEQGGRLCTRTRLGMPVAAEHREVSEALEQVPLYFPRIGIDLLAIDEVRA